jgi:mRNA interferase MazF
VRPALIVSAEPLGIDGRLFWAMMITSMAGRELWPGDIPIGDRHADYGLPVPCLVRTA